MDTFDVTNAGRLKPEPGEGLFELLGGRSVLERVHRVFYGKVYAHPWLKGFFKNIDREFIEKQQTDYQTMRMGAGNIYTGKLLKGCHQHMFINDELFDLRMVLLQESMRECGIPERLAARWLDMVRTSRREIVKADVGECLRRFPAEDIIVIPRPV
jgi:hemoglobin